MIPVHEPVAPSSWTAYAKDWLRRHERSGEFALLTQRSPPDDPAGNLRLEIIQL